MVSVRQARSHVAPCAVALDVIDAAASAKVIAVTTRLAVHMGPRSVVRRSCAAAKADSLPRFALDFEPPWLLCSSAAKADTADPCGSAAFRATIRSMKKLAFMLSACALVATVAPAAAHHSAAAFDSQKKTSVT